MKKWLSILLSFAIVMSLSLSFCSADIFKNDVKIAEARAQNIFSEFSDEISYVEDKYDRKIGALDPETLDILKQEAVLNLENDAFDFAALMDAIAIANTEAALSNYNSSTTVYRSFGILKGNYFGEIATGGTVTVGKVGSVGVSAGEELFGVTLSAGVTKSIQYSFAGPADYTKLYDGETLATHRIAFGVLYGTILKTEFDDPRTGTHKVYYKIDDSTASIDSYTTLASIGIPTYANKVRVQSIIYFPNQNSLREMIEAYPGRLIGG